MTFPGTRSTTPLPPAFCHSSKSMSPNVRLKREQRGRPTYYNVRQTS